MSAPTYARFSLYGWFLLLKTITQEGAVKAKMADGIFHPSVAGICWGQ